MAGTKKVIASTDDGVEFDDPSHASHGPGGAAGLESVHVGEAAINPAVIDALGEIQLEAEQARHTLAFAKSDQPESVVIPELVEGEELSSEHQQLQRKELDERTLERLRLRALRQRELGLKQLTTSPIRKGDMVLMRSVQVNDVPISNMVKRFVAIADRLLSRLHGFGALILGEEKAAKSIEILSAYIDELHRDAKTLYEQTKTAMRTHQEKQAAAGDEWIVPAYARTALDVEVHLMRREGNKMLEAFLLYDKSIELLRVLEWNDGTDPGQIDDIVNRARKMGSKIFRSALAGQIELGRRLQRTGGNDGVKAYGSGSAAPAEHSGPEEAAVAA